MASLGSTPGLVIAAGVGAAASVALEPAFEVPKQDAWARLPNRILDVGTLARLVAQGGVLLGQENGSTDGSAYAHARRQGYGSEELKRLIWLELTTPDLAEVLSLWRRGVFGNPTDKTAIGYVDHALAKEQIEPAYWEPLKELFFQRLTPAEVALGIVRSVIADPGIMPVSLDLSDATIARYPTLADPATGQPVNAYDEARASGVDPERLTAMVGEIGRPMSLQEATSAYFRAVPTSDSTHFTLGDFHLAVLEGDTRPEYARAILEQARQIPSVADYINAEIRGWIDRDARNLGIARHGMKPADGDLLYLRTGRPATTHQVHIGWARGGRNPAAGTDEREVFGKAVKESDVRPEWEDILWAQRYTYPPFFALRALMQGGVLNADEAYQLLLYEGWEPTLARKVADFYTTPADATAKENPYQVKADGQLWTALHKAYVKTGAQQSDVDPLLQVLVPDPATRLAIFSTWDVEKDAQSLAPPTP